MAPTVLVLEDESGLREVLGLMLEYSGYDVEAVRNGAEGLRRLREGLRPACVLLDLMMPIMDGPEFVRAMRADATLASIPVVVLSGITRMLDDPSSLGAAAYLEKPLDVPRVPDVVAEQCGPAR